MSERKPEIFNYLNEMWEERIEDVGSELIEQPKYKESLGRSKELYDQLVKVLDEDGKKLLGLLMDEETNQGGMGDTYLYQYGFKDGLEAAKMFSKGWEVTP